MCFCERFLPAMGFRRQRGQPAAQQRLQKKKERNKKPKYTLVFLSICMENARKKCMK